MEKTNQIKLKFLGGAGTVTGSKTLVEVNGKRILVDCGLFQGLKFLRQLNWNPLTVDASTIDAILLTHGHLDHCGYIPVLIKNGFRGTIHCTHPTFDLTKIILLDSGKIQEEDANRANRYGYSKHTSAKPLYTQNEAFEACNYFVTHNYDEWVILDNNIKFQLLNAGHILGSAMIELKVLDKTFLFSGDIGRRDPMLLYPPKKVKQADYLIMESTYGDREHSVENAKKELLEIVNETCDQGGILMIPSFAVERTQELIYLLYELREEGLINYPVYLDSPMGVNATHVFEKYPEWQDLSKFAHNHMYQSVNFVSSYEQSKMLVKDKQPKIVLAGSGMLEGGRILHYLNNHMQDEKNTLLFVGFQAAGTRGKEILSGGRFIKFFGDYHEVKCQVKSISSMSAHGDRKEIVDWMKNFETPPKCVFLNHGEPHQSDSFRVLIESKLGWNVVIPQLEEAFKC